MLIHTATLENEIITNYQANDGLDIARFEEIGQEWQRRYNWHAHPRPSGGRATGHTYVDTRGPPKHPLPPPTTADTGMVNTILPHQGSRWKFEKTVYQNPHHGPLNFRRIIHLFARIDDYGQIQDVSARCHRCKAVTNPWFSAWSSRCKENPIP